MEHRTAWQQDTAFRPSIKTIRLFVSYQGLIGAMPHVRCVRRRDNKKKKEKNWEQPRRRSDFRFSTPAMLVHSCCGMNARLRFVLPALAGERQRGAGTGRSLRCVAWKVQDVYLI